MYFCSGALYTNNFQEYVTEYYEVFGCMEQRDI